MSKSVIKCCFGSCTVSLWDVIDSCRASCKHLVLQYEYQKYQSNCEPPWLKQKESFYIKKSCSLNRLGFIWGIVIKLAVSRPWDIYTPIPHITQLEILCSNLSNCTNPFPLDSIKKAAFMETMLNIPPMYLGPFGNLSNIYRYLRGISKIENTVVVNYMRV